MQIILYLFWLAALLDLIADWTGFIPLRMASKPLLMILLGLWYFKATAAHRTATHKLLLVAFAFSWAGDIFLMNNNEMLFLPGLVSFLITHVLYIIGFRKEINRVPGDTLLKKNPIAVLPVLLLLAGMLLLIFNHIPAEMKIPVVIYSSVITLMVITSLNRYGKVSATSFRLTAAGALLFMLSDSLIAINKFYLDGTLWKSSFFIMLLYIFGQFLIARGRLELREMNFAAYSLPFIAAGIGWFTNYIAIKMLFYPQKRIAFGPFAIQGIFPKRQEEVAERIGRLVSEELLSVHDIKDKINRPETMFMINQKVEAKINDYLTSTFPANYPIMSIFVSDKIKNKLKNDFLHEVDDLAPQIVEQYIINMEGDLNIAGIIKQKISLLSPAKLEGLMYSILEKEFRFIELIGAVLGFFIGVIQVGLVMI